MERKSHYFWAVKLPDETKQLMHDRVEQEKELFLFQRWVHKADYHITLAFLGFAEEEKLQTSVRLIEKALQHETAFSLKLNHIGVFGSRQNPRIFWGGVAEEKRLFQLQSLVYQACQSAGFTLEKRPFAPHVTLARKWKGQTFNEQWLLEHNPFKEQEIQFPVKEVVLYRTNMDSTPKYEVIRTVILADE